MKCLKREEKFIAGIPPNRREQQQQKLWQRLPYKHFEITPAQYDETQQIAINKKKSGDIPESNFPPKILELSVTAR